jgi:transcriptional regulator with XRE-family HTH domain
MTTMHNSTLSDLEARRRALKMSTENLAKRSKVSRATVCRILKGDYTSASFKNVAAVARSLGMEPLFREEASPEEYLEQEAERKARYAMSLVQGTMGLEGQGLSLPQKEALVQESKERLLAGSRRKVWR